MSGFDIVGAVNVSITATSANGAITTALSDSRNTVLIVSTTDLYWNSGIASVTATTSDKLLPAGVGLLVTLPYGHDNIGAIRDSADGTLTIYHMG
jgi:hypothetical protein